MNLCPPVVELRQYTLRSGKRDVLVELFDREFVEPQRAAGAHVLGQFVDVDDPDRFVWLRGFDSMEARARSLATFYGGPVWQANRKAANATILDSDNVLLLRPNVRCAEVVSGETKAAGLFTATIYYVAPALLTQFGSYFEAHRQSLTSSGDVSVLASFVSSGEVNNFPGLPVREGESVFVWFERFAGEMAQRSFAARTEWLSAWRAASPESLLPAFMRKPEVLRLRPTAGSALR